MLESALAAFLERTPTLKIATADPQGHPWIAAAFFAAEGPYRLFTLLEGRGRTLANLLAARRAAILVETGDAFTLFAQADASAGLAEDRHAWVRDALCLKTPVATPMVCLPDLVAVRFEVGSWRLTDVTAGWLPARTLARPTTRAGTYPARPAATRPPGLST